jgi:hypothetical protein
MNSRKQFLFEKKTTRQGNQKTSDSLRKHLSAHGETKNLALALWILFCKRDYLKFFKYN